MEAITRAASTWTKSSFCWKHSVWLQFNKRKKECTPENQEGLHYLSAMFKRCLWKVELRVPGNINLWTCWRMQVDFEPGKSAFTNHINILKDGEILLRGNPFGCIQPSSVYFLNHKMLFFFSLMKHSSKLGKTHLWWDMRCEMWVERFLWNCLKGNLSLDVLENLTYYITVNIPICVVSLF